MSRPPADGRAAYALHWYTSPQAFNEAAAFGYGAPQWLSSQLAIGWRIQQIVPVQAAPGEPPGVLVLVASPGAIV